MKFQLKGKCFSPFRVFLIQRPLQRVVANVFTDTIKILFIPYDVVVISGLPGERDPLHRSVFCYADLEPADHGAKIAGLRTEPIAGVVRV